MAQDYTNDMIVKSLSEMIKRKTKGKAQTETVLKFLETEDFKDLYAKIIGMISDNATDTIEDVMYEKVLEERAFVQEFLARQEQKWGKCFVASEAMYICVLESAEAYTEYVNENKEKFINENAVTFNALRMIHARACQEYLEVLVLNRNGLADGAYARWRSMYELSIISSFIRKYGDDVAVSFLNAADTKDRYEWARKAKCFDNVPKTKYITFSAIQKDCEMATKDWREMYNLSNQFVHASPQGTVYRLGNKNDVEVLSVGQSDYGVTIPAVHSAVSLSLITADFFSLYAHGDSLVSMLAFHKWIKRLADYYQNTEKECFHDDNPLVIK
jgi:hypothetical protein